MNKVDEIMALVQQLGTSEHNQDDGQALYFENEIRKAIEAIAQPAGEAEPVYQVKQAIGASVWADASKDEFIEAVRHDLKRRILYTTPQQSQPLTDEQIKGLLFTAMGDKWVKIPTGWLRFVCLIEAAHGIKKGVTE